MNSTRLLVATCVLVLSFIASPGFSQTAIPPYDMWTDEVQAAIRDRSTLDLEIIPHASYSDVFFTSNPSGDWYDSVPPYTEHKGEKIRIHAFLASPLVGGPYPALVLGHGHGGHADSTLTQWVALLGYVAFYIDGPQAGQSTGGPHDDNQAWISVDSGPQYSYLYHYAYAGMRALTALEAIAALPGNPYRIDTQRFGVLGASMGGIFASQINGIDSRVKAAVALASAGSWQHTLRYPNSWLYHGIYTGTRDVPYDGSDPLNSIEDVDTDPTAISFVNHFDPIRYAPRQFAPLLTIIGTHDQYFPTPNANLMEQAIVSAGTQPRFEKRLWFLPNAVHQFDTTANLISVTAGVQEWLRYCFGDGSGPLATPQVKLSTGSSGGLRFDISLAESQDRLSGTQVVLYAATRIDTSAATINDFKGYSAALQGDHFVAEIPAGEKTASGDLITADNVLYFATATDGQLLPVSSLMYKGALPIDLSTDFAPVIGQFPGDTMIAPPPPLHADAAITVASSLPVPDDHAYQGMALTNATDQPIAVRVEARSPEGRLAAGEGLINPVFIPLPAHTQQIFLAEQWLGPGARAFDGSLQAGWSATRTDSLAFRGNTIPAELDEIGPGTPPSTALWLPLVPEQDPKRDRLLRILSTSSTAAAVRVVFRNLAGAALSTQQVAVSPMGTSDLTVPVGDGDTENASAEIDSSVPVSARMEVRGGADPWSIEAQAAPSAVKYVQPHVEWHGTFVTRLLMLNTSSSVLDVRLQLHLPSGAPAASAATKSVNPYESVNLTIESLFGTSLPAERGAGWLEAIVPGGKVVIAALAVDPVSGAGAASTLLPLGTSSWSLPFYVENSAYWTGLALANDGDSSGIISVTAYDRSGAVLGHAEATLEPQQSRTELVYQWIPSLPAGTTGYILITASTPVAPLAYFGTSDGASLAAIPFTPTSP
jgi:dienelactone hydrolase